MASRAKKTRGSPPSSSPDTFDAAEREYAEARGLREVWAVVDRLDATVKRQGAEIAALKRFAATSDERVGIAQAARAIPCDAETVRRLLREGSLRGGAQRLPGRSKLRRFVYVASLREFLASAASAASESTISCAAEPDGDD